MIDPAAEQFDAITLSHVIEHVHDPVEVIRACFNLLKSGGYIWLDTPNIASGFGSFIWFQLAYTFAGAILMGMIREWSGSLVYITIVHMAVNWIAVHS